jgi:hypothetical protein
MALVRLRELSGLSGRSLPPPRALQSLQDVIHPQTASSLGQTPLA